MLFHWFRLVSPAVHPSLPTARGGCPQIFSHDFFFFPQNLSPIKVLTGVEVPSQAVTRGPYGPFHKSAELCSKKNNGSWLFRPSHSPWERFQMLRCSGPSGQIYSRLVFFTHFFPCSYALQFQWCCSLPALLPRVHLQAASASALSPRAEPFCRRRACPRRAVPGAFPSHPRT